MVKLTFDKFTKKSLIRLILFCLILNIGVFVFAIPGMYNPVPNFARDFSAYYQGAWRLIHNPTQVYSLNRTLVGDYPIANSMIYKYAPSFLFIILPFLALPYQEALMGFNLLQLLSVFALAFFVYELVKNSKPILAIIVSVVVLLQPLPVILSGDFYISLSLPISGYYGGWVNANAHILQTVLLVGAIFFVVYSWKPLVSALLFSFGCLDPRIAILALPVLVWYTLKVKRSKRFILYSVFFIFLENLPFFFYNNIGQSFIASTLNFNVGNQLYSYEWLPIYSILCLSALIFYRQKTTRYQRCDGKTEEVEQISKI